MSPKRILERVRGPDEAAAEDRAWAVVRAAYQEREAVTPRRALVRNAVVVVVALVVGAVALSPAGATVGRLITRALGVKNAAPALSSLPAPGRLLVSNPAGTWTVAPDGSLRRLGPWPRASWSPHGLYVAASRGDELSALDPRGQVKWSLGRPSVGEARWFTPSGYRVAYLSAGDLRVVAGDGTGDHLLARRVASVAPEWRPGHDYQVAYVSGGERVVLRDADSGRVLWAKAAGAGVRQLQWSADGRFLLTASRTAVRLYRADGSRIWTETAAAGAPWLEAALSPDGRTVAFVRGGNSPEVVLDRAGTHKSGRRVLSGVGLRQVLWSPDGRWLLISWPAANQWVFVRVVGAERIAAVSHIAQQFSGGRTSSGFPRLEGWCCTAGR